MSKFFKPMLIPNNKEETINWKERIKNPEDWIVLFKRDGARVEISHKWVKGRSLKHIVNKQIIKMAQKIQSHLEEFPDVIIEAEFYSHEMSFPEIMHFFRTEDITSPKTKEKYLKLWEKTKGLPSKGWKFPGRSVEWLTTWHDSLHFRLFDTYNGNTKTKAALRYAKVVAYSIFKHCSYGPVYYPKTHQEIEDLYFKALSQNYEGLVLMHKEKPYKFGRATIKEQIIYKMKDDKLVWDAEIIDLVQATVVNPLAPTTTNELGRTVTSKKQDDRLPIEAISGFKVRLDSGLEQKVSLKGWDDAAKARAWELGPEHYRGRWILFTGMKGVKGENSAVRHAQFKCFRDEK